MWPHGLSSHGQSKSARWLQLHGSQSGTGLSCGSHRRTSQPLVSYINNPPALKALCAPQLQSPLKAAQAIRETSFPSTDLATFHSNSSQAQNEPVWLHGSPGTAPGAPQGPAALVGTGAEHRGSGDRKRSLNHREVTGPRATDSSAQVGPSRTTGSGNRNVMTGGLAHHMESPRHSGQTLRQGTSVPLWASHRKTYSIVTNGNHTINKAPGPYRNTPLLTLPYSSHPPNTAPVPPHAKV